MLFRKIRTLAPTLLGALLIGSVWFAISLLGKDAPQIIAFLAGVQLLIGVIAMMIWNASRNQSPSGSTGWLIFGAVSWACGLYTLFRNFAPSGLGTH